MSVKVATGAVCCVSEVSDLFWRKEQDMHDQLGQYNGYWCPPVH